MNRSSCLKILNLESTVTASPQLMEPPTLTIVKHLLDKAVREWMELGLFIDDGQQNRAWGKYWDERQELPNGVRPEKPTSQPTQARDSQLRSLIRLCAKDLGRPFVLVEATLDYSDRSRPIGYWEINLPNTDRMAPIVSHLLLAAQPITTRTMLNPPYTGMPPVGTRPRPNVKSKPSRQTFWIRDMKVFDMWLDRCKCDPIFKKALGTLPAKVK